MYRSGNTSPGRSTTPLYGLDDDGIRKFKPLPKRRRMMDFGSHGASLPYPLTGAHTPGVASNPAPANAIGQDRSWSVATNFPDIEKVMNLNSSFTREQFIAHAGEFAKRLQHQLQGGRLPSVTGDRMEFVQAFLQQHRDHVAELSLPQPSSPKASSSESEIQPPEESTTYSVSVPLPTLSPNAKFDLDAMFSAQFEASLAGAVGSFDRFDEGDVLPESWEEVAEIYYSHRPAPPPPSAPTPVPLHMTGVTSDLGRRGLRDGEEDEDDEGDGDYDHLRQPGNAKKRKTPANANNSWHSQTRGDPDDEGIDELGGFGGSKGDGTRPEQREGVRNNGGDQGADKGGHGSGGNGVGNGLNERAPGSYHGICTSRPLGRLPLSALSSFASSASSSARVGQLKAIVRARGKLAGAMVAGVQHKEMLKARKRQLEAVLGVLSSNSPSESGAVCSPALDSTLNSLALDQALTMVGPSPLPIGDSTRRAVSLGASTGNRDGHQVAPHSGTKENARIFMGPPIRLSQRTSVRRARALAKTAGSGPRLTAPLPTSQFTFRCDSVAKGRTKAAQEAALKLRHRFETELERQATTAAKMAAASRAANILEAASTSGAGSNSAGNPMATKQKKTKTGVPPSKNRVANSFSTHGPSGLTALPKSSGPAQQPAQQQQRQPQGNNKSSQKENANPQQQQPASQVPPSAAPPNKPKKKKRSAMANASNPHHLRNYVPSRLPHSGDGHSQGHGGPSGLLGPLPVRFLMAELPPRRGSTDPAAPVPAPANVGGKKKGGAGGSNGPSAALAPGSTDEWICMFCEYDLYYGDEVAFRRAVRSRKKVLKRRRRARERAAAAANGMKQYGKPPVSGQAPTPPAGATGVNGAPVGQSEGEENDDLEQDYDGDPGYEQGGNGRDEFGNVPKGQLNGIPAGGGGRGTKGRSGARHMVDPAS